MSAFPEGFEKPCTLAGHGTSASTPVLVGFSGGADSTALLLCMLALRESDETPVYAVHVHHGLRGAEADRDRRHCIDFCRAHAVPLFLCDENVPAQRLPGESEETAARRIRYRAFARVMEENEIPILALAHHADDQLETVLFRLGRGTGLRGLCGMPRVRVFSCGYLVRPLLYATRKELVALLGDTPYVTDSTNADPAASRNRIRMDVLPALAEATGDPVRAAARMTQTLSADEAYLAGEAERLLAPATVWEGGKPLSVSADAIASAPDVLALRWICRLLENGGADPGATHLQDVLALCRIGKPGSVSVPPRRRAVLSGGRLSCREQLTRTECGHNPIPVTLGVPVIWESGGVRWECLVRKAVPGDAAFTNVHNLSTGFRLNFSSRCDTIIWRPRAPGDKLLSGGMHKQVRRLLQQAGVEKSLRPHLPVLYVGEDVLWVPFARSRDGAAEADGAFFCTVYARTDTPMNF